MWLLIFACAVITFFGSVILIAQIDVNIQMKRDKLKERMDYADQIIEHCLRETEIL